MTILFDPSRQVKPSPSSTFAAGLVAPARRPQPDADDRAWWAAESNRETSNYAVLVPAPAPVRGGSPEPDWDALFDEALGQARLDMGLCC